MDQDRPLDPDQALREAVDLCAFDPVAQPILREGGRILCGDVRNGP